MSSPRHRLEVDAAALAGLTGRGVAVAIIDSGVNGDHPHVEHVAGGVRIELSGECTDDFVDRLGHGTAVFAAIQEKAPASKLHAVRVFDDKLSTSTRALVSAIDWAAEKSVTLANLSLGTPKAGHAEPLAEAVARLGAGGGVVVAAAESDGQRWWPGSLNTTIGVVMDPGCPRDCVELRGDSFAASPYPRPIPGVPPERNLNGISFAVANVTGLLARLLEGVQGPHTAEGILERFRDAAG
ncbi:MAG: S8 family serine peptidase [Longimicrobiales bacterium]